MTADVRNTVLIPFVTLSLNCQRASDPRHTHRRGIKVEQWEGSSWSAGDTGALSTRDGRSRSLYSRSPERR